jgi:hypothetical protein
VNLNSFKNEINAYLVELFLQGSDDLSMDDNIVIFQCVYEFIENKRSCGKYIQTLLLRNHFKVYIQIVYGIILWAFI